MFPNLRAALRRHPLVRDAMVWALPAIAIGAVLRLLFLRYSPFAYWGSDSRSYYSFAHMLLEQGYVSLDEKRRYLYPLLMLPVSMLPGAPLRWLAWLQHGLGLASLVPMAYVVRKTLRFWKWWVIPVTLVVATMPIFLWYEHELLAETILFSVLAWALAGWCAWAGDPRGVRGMGLYWWFFAPLALLLITKPAARFIVPGVFLGLLGTGLWRQMRWKQWGALAALCLVALTVGARKHAAWLLYTATFPLTQLETPLHAEYKAQIRDLVEPLQREPDTFYLHDEAPFNFLENPSKYPERPLWAALEKDTKAKSRIYFDLAREGIKAHPGTFLYFAWQRIVGSANVSDFKLDRFTPEYYPERFEHDYERALAARAAGKSDSAIRALALPKRGELPPYEQVAARLSPAPQSFAARFLNRWVEAYQRAADVVRIPKESHNVLKARPTLLGAYFILGAVLSLLPGYRRTLGVWMIVGIGYLWGVFLVSQMNPRYFAPAWPMFIPLLAVPLDALLAVLAKGRETKMAQP